MSTQSALFDLEPVQVDDDLRALTEDAVSCRYCQTLTTVQGVDRRGHGPDHGYAECDRMHALFPDECPEVVR